MSKPKIKVPVQALDRAIDSATFLILCLMLLLTINAYPSLPETIPTHFNGAGNVDGYGDKSVLLVLPGIGLFMCIGLFILIRFPHIFNFPVEINEQNAEIQYILINRMMRTLNFVSVSSFCFITFRVIESANGNGGGTGYFFLPIMISGTIIPIIIYIYLARKNA